MRGEAFENVEPPSWALERVRQYGMAGLFPGFQNDFPFILYAQSVPCPAWSGKRDFHRERLHEVYEFLITAGGEIPESEAAGKISDGFNASGGFPACETNISVNALLAGKREDRLSSSI